MDIARQYYDSNYFKKFGKHLLSDPIEVSATPVACGEINTGVRFVTWDYLKPKLHTMREDPHDRWKPGTKIHFAVGIRTKNYFRFAPVLECVSMQTVVIKEWAMCSSDQCYQTKDSRVWTIDVDGIRLKTTEIEELSVNDGFESMEQFFKWFNKPGTYKLIHWTDKRY